MEAPEVTLSIGDAAKELGISIKTLRRWADSGK
ncbi:MerR family DNA-binding transcriptional regulator, partial [Coleofasciculus sp. G3-WIS-01]